ncbi:cupredoxin domain-containing protein [Sphingomonas colocasiae]|uniref:Cupredoxin domain-containing protein n=1 Tax=Sphingomonas colocasiae TaxID=1848973 RepID=A0ABS7PUB1_9SPHN|nr:cupredoxin domain-containing protein [Sphingomonas colocasiae]MBY8824569.1 cupredoxin domain-containing protein [Sphingomonas colocasiae]
MHAIRTFVLALLIAPTPLLAQSPAGQEIVLADFSFTPASLHLKAEQPVTLHFVNRGSGGHNFAAPEFFAAARIDRASAAVVKRGKVELAKGASTDVTLVPARGHYHVHCSHLLHSGLGMTGDISVD